MENKILTLLGSPDYAPLNVPQLLAALGFTANQQQKLQAAIRSLQTSGQILRTKGNRYILAESADLIPGVIQITRNGKGFLLPDEEGVGEILIPESATSTAMNGDRVLVRRELRKGSFRFPEGPETVGSVVRILERNRSQIVGTLKRTGRFLYVVADDSRFPHDILVPTPKDVGRPANIGDKVVVEFTSWESRHVNPEGEIIEVLGSPDEEGVDMLAIIRNYELPLHFPKNVLKEANTIAKSRPTNQPLESEFEGRLDCRDHLVITIDPDDAKDFDDAICIKRISKDRWKLWVHIADVSYYVTQGSALDVEAQKRGNSTYLVDRVIPMLPEALSNELCSLKPSVDRLTKCVEFDLSDQGEVLDAKFYSAVIHSKRRFTYKEAFAILQQNDSPSDEIERMLHYANDMAQKIRRRRFKSGALDLEFPESKIRLDDKGRVLRIEKIDNDISHQLIEEFMLLANEAVAGHLMEKQIPGVYRVHEAPKGQKLQMYRDDVQANKIPCGDLTVRQEVQKLLERLKDVAIGRALRIGFLRSLMRARYSVEPLGHYGLAKAKYTHFTSPIRRYADLVVHRALFDKVPLSGSALKRVCDHISGTEKTSSDAERDSKEVKMYAFLKLQVKTGKRHSYSGLVTDIRNFGFFVDVPDLGLSGLVHLSSMQDDVFVYNPSNNTVYGRKTGRVIRLGDEFPVQVQRVDDYRKMVDFQLVKGAEVKTKTKSKFAPKEFKSSESDKGKSSWFSPDGPPGKKKGSQKRNVKAKVKGKKKEKTKVTFKKVKKEKSS